MASEAQRRARREARRQEGASPPRRPARPTANGGGDARPEPHREHHHRRGGFVRESWGELQKVEWPNQNQVIQGTVVVIVACVIVGVYLWLSDEVFRRIVQQFFLGQ